MADGRPAAYTIVNYLFPSTSVILPTRLQSATYNSNFPFPVTQKCPIRHNPTQLQALRIDPVAQQEEVTHQPLFGAGGPRTGEIPGTDPEGVVEEDQAVSPQDGQRASNHRGDFCRKRRRSNGLGVWVEGIEARGFNRLELGGMRSKGGSLRYAQEDERFGG